MKFIITAVMSVLLAFSTVYAQNGITVSIDGEPIYFKEAAPVIVNDRTYVPLRAIFESLGAYVEWDGVSRTVYAHKRLSHIIMPVDEGIYYVNSKKHNMVAVPLLIDDRMMLPVRDVSEAIGAEILWSAAERKVIISSPEENYDVDDKYLEFWKKHGEEIVLTGVAAYPHINGEGQIFEAFNEFILGESESYADKVTLEYYDVAKTAFDRAEDKEKFMPYMFERSFDITYDENSMISVLFNEEIYADGILPYVTYEAMTYNMKTGQLVDITDVLGEEEAVIRKKAREGFLSLIKDKPDSYFFDAQAILENGLGKLNWYIADDGVHFFINPGTVAPLSFGVIEIVL